MKTLFTANRVAAIATWAAGLAAFVAGIVQTLPVAWQNYALVAAGLLTKTGVALKFLGGSQKWDSLTALAALPNASPSGQALYAAAKARADAQIDPNTYKEGTAELLAVPVHVPDPNFNPVSRLAPQREDEAARSPSNPEVPS